MDMLPKIDAPKYCTICNLTFEGQEAYEKHQSKLHRKGNIECEYCYKRFLRKDYLATHIKSTHLAIKEEAKCHKCQKIYSNRDSLSKHDMLMHGPKTFQCEM